jgi:hypothetical protein
MVSEGARRVFWDRVVSPYSGNHDGGVPQMGSQAEATIPQADAAMR